MSKVTPYYTGLFAVRKFLKIKGRFSQEATILALDSLVQRTHKGSHCIRTSYTTPAISVQP